MFIIDAIITIPVALLGYLCLPALPGQRADTPTWWLSATDIELTARRMAAVGRAPPKRITRQRIKGFLRSWHLPVLTLLYTTWNNSLNAATIMPLWLKSFNKPGKVVYTVPQINHYPMPIIVCSVWSSICRFADLEHRLGDLCNFSVDNGLDFRWDPAWPPMGLAHLWEFVERYCRDIPREHSGLRAYCRALFPLL